VLKVLRERLGYRYTARQFPKNDNTTTPTQSIPIKNGFFHIKYAFLVFCHLNNTSDVLLNAKDIPATWTGSSRSSPVPFVPQADSLVIRAVVLEKDTFSDDDISPGIVNYWKPVPSAGHSGSSILDYGGGKSRVGYQYEFIRQ